MIADSRTEDRGLALALTIIDKRLDELGRFELDFPRGRLGVELPHTRAHVEHVHAARLHARTIARHLTDLEERQASSVASTGGRCGHSEEATRIVRGRRGNVMEAGSDPTVEADELGEVGEEAGRFV